VTVDVRSGSIVYSAGDKATVPPTNVPLSNNRDLTVKPGDTVAWQVLSNKMGNNPPAHRLTILFLPNQTPFVDKSGNPVYAFEGSKGDDGGPNLSGTINPNITCEEYEFYVAVIDDAGGQTYTDDPKIIVGNAIMDTTNGKLIDVKLIHDAGSDLQEAARLNSALRKTIESAERKLNHLRPR